MVAVYKKSGRDWSLQEIGLWARSSGKVKYSMTKFEEVPRKEVVCFLKGPAPISDVECIFSPS